MTDEERQEKDEWLRIEAAQIAFNPDFVKMSKKVVETNDIIDLARQIYNFIKGD